MPAGVIAAVRRGRLLDQVLMILALLGISVPSFWLGLNLILPAISLGLAQAALIARMTRSSMLDVLRQDYMRTARAKGLKETLVVWKHGLRNALIPTLTVIGMTVSTLAGGAVVTETVFNVPGAGRLLLQSVLRRDYPVIQGAVLYVALLWLSAGAAQNLLLPLNTIIFRHESHRAFGGGGARSWGSASGGGGDMLHLLFVHQSDVDQRISDAGRGIRPCLRR